MVKGKGGQRVSLLMHKIGSVNRYGSVVRERACVQNNNFTSPEKSHVAIQCSIVKHGRDVEREYPADVG